MLVSYQPYEATYPAYKSLEFCRKSTHSFRILSTNTGHAPCNASSSQEVQAGGWAFARPALTLRVVV
jgi:hypothetical protein